MKFIFVAVALLLVGVLAESDAIAAQASTGGDHHPTFGHVVIIVEENSGIGYLLESKKEAPYFNSLAEKYGLATEYYANTHPSIGNYMVLIAGQVLTNNDHETPASFPVSADNLVRQLAKAGKSWKAYAEGLPEVGYLGADRNLYAVRHVPIAYLTDLRDVPEQRANLVPFTQFAQDLRNHSLPDFSFITPDLCHDAHHCRIDAMDKWLQAVVSPLLEDEEFKKDGLLIITFDEAWGSDDMHGGGRIATLLISPAYSKRAYRSTAFYQHQSTLRLILEGLGLDVEIEAVKDAAPMWEFFDVKPD
ncbi:MAG TPA: alkaline phosphatase family protein [Steroidobacteraceae bacterium]|nr:alkaline phosphatase family protein [Steroidobacteraceae bacterium]